MTHLDPPPQDQDCAEPAHGSRTRDGASPTLTRSFFEVIALAAAEERMHAAAALVGEQLAEDFTAGRDTERLHQAVNDMAKVLAQLRLTRRALERNGERGRGWTALNNAKEPVCARCGRAA